MYIVFTACLSEIGCSVLSGWLVSILLMLLDTHGIVLTTSWQEGCKIVNSSSCLMHMRSLDLMVADAVIYVYIICSIGING